MFALTAGIQGFLMGKVIFPLRLMAIAGGLMLIDPGRKTDFIGLAIIAVAVVIHFVLRARRGTQG
jgi:TRAP-type uncharacterized transport system fused permease subunit